LVSDEVVLSLCADAAAILALANRQPESTFSAAHDLTGSYLGVLAELLLRGVDPHRLGLRLMVRDALNIAVRHGG
jgi:hypothetical protein